jgi:hypothetical protein
MLARNSNSAWPDASKEKDLSKVIVNKELETWNKTISFSIQCTILVADGIDTETDGNSAYLAA